MLITVVYSLSTDTTVRSDFKGDLGDLVGDGLNSGQGAFRCKVAQLRLDLPVNNNNQVMVSFSLR